jgi:hypothetical protein
MTIVDAINRASNTNTAAMERTVIVTQHVVSPAVNIHVPFHSMTAQLATLFFDTVTNNYEDRRRLFLHVSDIFVFVFGEKKRFIHQ